MGIPLHPLLQPLLLSQLVTFPGVRVLFCMKVVVALKAKCHEVATRESKVFAVLVRAPGFHFYDVVDTASRTVLAHLQTLLAEWLFCENLCP